MRRSFGCFCLGCLILLGTGTAFLGCARLHPNHGESYEGDDAEWGASLRPQQDQQEEFFFNEKSRQIEKSLGF